MPLFRIKGAEKNTGKDIDETVERGDLQSAKHYAQTSGYLVEEINEVKPPKPPILTYANLKAQAESNQSQEEQRPEPTPEQYHQYELLKLGEIADSVKSIRGWVSFWSILAIISIPILILLGFLVAK